MQKWEYLVVVTFGNVRYNPEVQSINGAKPQKEIHLNEYLQELGELGWELTTSRTDTYFFKRPKNSN